MARDPSSGGRVRPLLLVLAMSENGVIGNRGKVPWHYPEDLRHFRQTTEGHAIVMGRKTYLEVGKPLPRRRNLVVSSQLPSAPGIEVFASLSAALAAAYESDEEPRVIGGKAIFEEALPLATTIWLTRVRQVVDGDVSVDLDLSRFRRVFERQSGDLSFERWERTQ